MASATPAAQVMASQVTEKQFLQQVRDLAKARHWKAYFVYDSRRTPPGWPDVFAVRGVRAVAMELKSEKGKTTVEQEEWLLALSQAGVETYVFRPSDWEAIEAVLK